MRIVQIILLFLVLNSLYSCGVKQSLRDRPDISGLTSIDTLRIKHNDSLYSIGRNKLLKNKYGIWELYVEGDALERGLVNGSLTRELMQKQEKAIMEKIESLVPAGGYQNFLANVVAWFNRNMHKHVPEEYKQEIYGISRFALPEYDSFAPPYVRALYLHGAHDIGHALQDLMLVGCTSFAAWDHKTTDGQLLLGRNFDFNVGDEFAEEKVAAFINPAEGNKFMMYTWGGMIGVVSGMNEKGLTVTINAGRSKIPFQAKTPISLVAREILQYAGTTAEAVAIARKREVFVSEAIMVGSAAENKAILIEVSPRNFGVYEVENTAELICSNHFQSEAYKRDNRNLKAIEESHTAYRFERMTELVAREDKLDPVKAAHILRNTNGLNDSRIGYGNEMAINQLLAHHGVIFKPGEKKMWISANPYQLGAFVGYDLNEAFKKFQQVNMLQSVALEEETIPEDDFVKSRDFKNYSEFRTLSLEIQEAIKEGKSFPQEKLLSLPALNPHYWKAYFLVGEYFYKQGDYKNAIVYFKQALKREVTTLPDEKLLKKRIKKSYRKI
ncbi:acyl-CoA--6-aminopenicillanic acid acyl-transferase [Antarcticibacterium flavum]|uniref:Acyl-CoA--6-aminopenicillanic acid acyl-transferase n=1 Tax=Antarcticibacterium flavum TaxID=2058175 RepID=A0A5B7WYG1_9FLAO|nr:MULTISPECIES: C45 family autoproteolytic acyltransferase/hydolase [Antarcticibacterium]MCM4158833.1 acyl-CoA--6-aminopenicillanic acid acyl-transferase [Antarcticibacterium sp. W02-3]QCY68097.1 acyl-CoA--6-aminopenicillanic acid acyl-transferase [Antarcticibacterium flavum]